MKYLKGNSSRLMIALGVLGLIAGALVLIYARSFSIQPEVRDTIGWVITTVLSLSGLAKGLLNLGGTGKQEQAAARTVQPAWTFISPKESGGGFYRLPSFVDPFLSPVRKESVPAAASGGGIGWSEFLRLALLAVLAGFAVVGVETVFPGWISPQSLLWIFGAVVLGFGVVGARVGWAGGMMLSLALAVALSMTSFLREYWPAAFEGAGAQGPGSGFVIQGVLVFLLAFMGFASLKTLPARAAPLRLPDRLLGGVLGLMNGYLAAGTLLFLMLQNGFGHGWTGADPSGLTLEQLTAYLPPAVFAGPGQAIFTVLILIFVILIFV